MSSKEAAGPTSPAFLFLDESPIPISPALSFRAQQTTAKAVVREVEEPAVNGRVTHLFKLLARSRTRVPHPLRSLQGWVPRTHDLDAFCSHLLSHKPRKDGAPDGCGE